MLLSLCQRPAGVWGAFQFCMSKVPVPSGSELRQCPPQLSQRTFPAAAKGVCWGGAAASPALHHSQVDKQMSSCSPWKRATQLWRTLASVNEVAWGILSGCSVLFWKHSAWVVVPVWLSDLTCPCSFLKLYTTMPVAKLAGFLDMSEQEFRIQLLVFKHKMKNLVWTSGISALDGEFQSASEVDFYIDKVSEWMLKPLTWKVKILCFFFPSFYCSLYFFLHQTYCILSLTSNELLSLLQDMIHIADTKVARRYGDFFIRQIHKFEEVRVGQFRAALLSR